MLGIPVSTSVLGFQRYLFFTGVNTKDHSPQPCTVGHTAVTSTGDKRASEDFHGLHRGCMKKHFGKESGLGELKAAGCGQWSLHRNAQGSENVTHFPAAWHQAALVGGGKRRVGTGSGEPGATGGHHQGSPRRPCPLLALPSLQTSRSRMTPCNL